MGPCDGDAVSSFLSDAVALLDASTTEPAEQLLDDAEESLAGDVPRLLDEARNWLLDYDGIPTAVNVFHVLRLGGRENAHTEFLAWLLDPGGSHGGSDEFLRSFLALLPIPAVQSLLAREAPLVAFVRTQYTFPNHGRPDVVVLIEQSSLHCTALVIEVKLGAPITRSESGPQTRAYVAALAGNEAIENNLLGPLRRRSRVKFVSADPYFIFLRATRTVHPEEETTKEADDQKWMIVEYPFVEHALAGVVRRLDLAASARSLIQQYRTSLLATAFDASCSLSAIQALRRLVSLHRSMPLVRLGLELNDVLRFTRRLSDD